MQASTNYLYILFLVIYVVYSIIKAGKKATAKSSNTTPLGKQPESQKDFTTQPEDEFKPVQPPSSAPFPEFDPGNEIKNILESFLGKNKKEKIPTAGTTPYHPHSSSTAHRLHNDAASTYPKSNVQVSESIKQKSTHKSLHEKNHESDSTKITDAPSDKNNPEVDFDLKQAVIYSTILNRPEY